MGMFDFFGNLIGAGVNAWNASENREAQRETNAQNLRIQQENLAWQKEAFQRNWEQQQDFAKSGLGWRVEDAKRSGLHPLAALGAQLSGGSPVSVGSADLKLDAPTRDLGDMGQNISRAVSALGTADEKGDATAAKIAALQVERGELENSLLKTQIMKANQPAAQQPSMPSWRKKNETGQPAIDAIENSTSSGFPVTQDKVEQKPDLIPATKRIPFFGIPLHTWKDSADAEDLETRYSDIGEKLGIANIPLDVGYTIWKNYIEHQWPVGRTFQDRWPGKARELTPQNLKRR